MFRVTLVARQGSEQWFEANTKMMAYVEEMDDKSAEIDSACEIVQDMVGKEKKDERKAKSNLRYQMHKHAKKFSATGTSLALAKLGSELLYWSEQDQDELPKTSFVALSADGVTELNFSKPFRTTTSASCFKDIFAELRVEERVVEDPDQRQHAPALQGNDNMRAELIGAQEVVQVFPCRRGH